ncbi:MAG: hypothetical protein OHK0015_18750 [Chloroflexi bacterium OHK40]
MRQLIAAHDLDVKAAFVQGKLNLVRCSHCKAVFSPDVATLYYDLEQGHAFVYVPAGPTAPGERPATRVRDLTDALRRSLAPEQWRSNLARPQRFSSPGDLAQAILKADGITPELLQVQAARAELLAALLQAPSEEELRTLARAHDAELDGPFFELLTAQMHAAHMAGDAQRAQTLLTLRTYLGRHSSRGQEVIAAIDARLGLNGIQSREELLTHLRQARDGAERAALVAQGSMLLDARFFQLLDAAAEQAARDGDAAAAAVLQQLRIELPALKAASEAQVRAALERAAALVTQVVSAPHPDRVLAENRAGLDEAFFVVLGATIERARRQGAQEPLRALELIGQLARTIGAEGDG